MGFKIAWEKYCTRCNKFDFTLKNKCWCNTTYKTMIHLGHNRDTTYCGLSVEGPSKREIRDSRLGAFKPMRFVNCEDCILMALDEQLGSVAENLDWRPAETIPEDHYAL